MQDLLKMNFPTKASGVDAYEGKKGQSDSGTFKDCLFMFCLSKRLLLLIKNFQHVNSV